MTRNWRAFLFAALPAALLSGCATQVIGALTIGQLTSIAGLASTVVTGKDLGEQALSLVTGKDCLFTEALLREDRDICEEPGSLATRDDFKGLFVAGIDAEGNVVRSAPDVLPANLGNDGDGFDPQAVWAAAEEVQFAQYSGAEIRVAMRDNIEEQTGLMLANLEAPAAVIADEPAPVVVARLDGASGRAVPVARAKPAVPEPSSRVVVELASFAPATLLSESETPQELAGIVEPKAKPASLRRLTPVAGGSAIATESAADGSRRRAIPE